MIIRLTWPEMKLAYEVAAQRRIMNLKKQLAGRYGAPEGEGSEELDIISTRGEMAVAKALNLYWSGTVGDYGAIDVGGRVEVRTCTQAHHSLILHDEDKDRAPYVLALAGSSPEVTLLGWVFGEEGKNRAYWKDPKQGRPAYFIPQAALRPMVELLQWLKEAA